MRKLLQLSLWITLLAFMSMNHQVSAQNQEIDWTTVKVRGREVQASDFPDGTVNLKLEGSIMEDDFKQLAKLKESLVRIDLSGLKFINTPYNKTFPSRGLQNFPQLKEVYTPSYVGVFSGSPFKGTQVNKIIINNEKAEIRGLAQNMWGVGVKAEDECKNITVIVPQGTLETYYSASPWKIFNLKESPKVNNDDTNTEEQKIKVLFHTFNVTQINVTDITGNSTQEVKAGSGAGCEIVTGHKIRIDAVGQDGYKFVFGNWGPEYGTVTQFQSLPFEFVAGEKNLSFNIKFGTVLTYSTKNKGGSISATKTVIEEDDFGDTEETDVPIASGSSYEEGIVSKLTFTAKPNDEYKVKAWYVDNALQAGQTANTFVINNPKKSINVEVEFESDKPKEITYKLKISSFNSKSITVTDKTSNKEVEFLNGFYNLVAGHTISITGEGMDGYEFDNGNYRIGYQAPTTFTSLPFEFTAADMQMQAVIRFSTIVKYSVIGNGGTLEAIKVEEDDYDDDESPVKSGTSFSTTFVKEFRFIAKPEKGFMVKSWYLDGKIQEDKTDNEFTVTSPTKSFKVEVEFEAVPARKYHVSLSSNNKKASGAEWIEFKNEGDTAYTKSDKNNLELPEGTSVKIVTKVNEGYTFDSFIVNEEKAEAISNESNEYSFETVLKNNIAVLAVFNPNVTFGVKGENGSMIAEIDGKPINSGTAVENGKKVVFNAIPSKAYRVKRWIVDGKDFKNEGQLFSEPILIITMEDSPKDVKVEFEAIPVKEFYIEMSTNNTEWGNIRVFKITPDTEEELQNGAKIKEGDKIQFRVTPDKDRALSGWIINGTKKEAEVDKDKKVVLTYTLIAGTATSLNGKISVVAELMDVTGIELPNHATTVLATYNQIIVETSKPGTYCIYSLDGKVLSAGKVSEGRNEIDIDGNHFIVVVNNKAFKVIRR